MFDKIFSHASDVVYFAFRDEDSSGLRKIYCMQ